MNLKTPLSVCFAVCAFLNTNEVRAQDSGSSTEDSTNFAIYDWNESLEAWELLYSGFDSSYDTQEVESGEYAVNPVPLNDGGGGGGGAVIVIQGRRSNPQRLSTQSEQEEPKKFPKMTVTGVKPPMQDSNQLSVLWVNERLNGLVGQRSASRRSVPAPNDTYQVNCADDDAEKSEAAMNAASHYGIRPIYSQTRRQITIKWRNGTVETYENVGRPSTMWMVPVPGTCREG